ncbi:MAG: hypothetical protein J6B23_03395 [Clostridia bacterium]|nr:hypothetical protein [Clostridia bacterium]
MNRKKSVFLTIILCFGIIFCSFSAVSLAEESDVSEERVHLVVGEGDFTDSNLNAGTFDGAWTGIKAVRTGGVGGKASDDMSSLFNVTMEQDKFRSIRYHYNISGYESDFYLVTDIYVTDGGVGSISFGTGNKYFELKGDGTVSVGNGSVSPVGEVKSNEWHRLVMSFVKTNGFALTMYLDGTELTTVNVGNLAGARQTLAFCADYGCLKGSNIAFDNTYLYSKSYEYDPHSAFLKPEITVDENVVKLQNGTIRWEDTKVSTVEELLGAIGIGNHTVRIYKDSSMKEEAIPADNLSGSEYIVVESADGILSYYPTLKEKVELISVEFTGDEASVGAKGVLSNTTSTPCNAVMIIVFKNENGIMKKVVPSEEVSVSGTDYVIEIAPVSADGLTAEVLFIDGWSTKLRLFDKIYSK